MTRLECSEEGCEEEVTCYRCVTCPDHCEIIERASLEEEGEEEESDNAGQ